MVTEISDMCNIYRNSSLTIFAAAGDHADSGLFAYRGGPHRQESLPCNVTVSMGVKSVSEVCYVTVGLLYSRESNDPLYKRGWVLQEQVLSSRALLFGSRQLSWQCGAGVRTKQRPDFEIGPLSVDGFDRTRIMLRPSTNTQTRGIRDFLLWHELVHDYSLRALTFSIDALPAISGLATAMGTTYGYSYVGGLWRENFAEDLLWRVVLARVNSLYISEREVSQGPSPPPTTFPSWTWASQWGKNIAWMTHYLQVTYEPLIELVSQDDNITSGTTQYTEVADKTIALRGRMKIFTVSEVEPGYAFFAEFQPSRWRAFLVDPDSRREIGGIAFDSDPAVCRLDQVYCLPCLKQSDIKAPLICLGLSPVDLSRTRYRRVGFVYLNYETEGWSNECTFYID